MRSIPASLSEIEHEDGRQGARTADHNDLVGSLLFVGEEQIAMVRFAGQYPGFAGSADPLLARGLYVEAAATQGCEDRLTGRDRYSKLRARQLDDEATLDGACDGRGEMFDMHALDRPRRSGRRERVEHARRAARIEMSLPRRRTNNARHIEHVTLLLVGMETDMSIAGQEPVEKGGLAPPPDRIVELPGTRERSQARDHRDDRCDTDAARDEHGMGRRLDERKIVARPSDLEDRADAKLVMHETRAAAARRLALDAQHVAVALVRGIGDRILPHPAGRQMQIDMGASGEMWNGRSRHRAELVEIHMLGRVGYRRQPHGDRLVERHRRARYSAARSASAGRTDSESCLA